MNHTAFMREAIRLANEAVHSNQGGPFGAVIVRQSDGQIIGRGNNRVTSTFDPTAHAEVVAIREACGAMGDFSLAGCAIYTSCEPCPMCLAAVYWARLDKIYYANTRADAAQIGFDDEFLYRELALPLEARQKPMEALLREEAQSVFQSWALKSDKIPY